MASERLRIAFVGHVDHGKSTLIGRLLCDTGSIPPDRVEEARAAAESQGRGMELAHLLDQLREEREQARTIDTAQLLVRTVGRDYAVIDAPGHREFLRNALSGASQADAAVLVVDASQGIGEQTRRHAILLSLLGIRRCIAAANKMDLVGWSETRFGEMREAIGELLAKAGLDGAACVPACATLGDNVAARSGRMPWYGGPSLLEALAAIPAARDAERPLRFCVQDVYAFDGRRIAAGRMESGMLGPGSPVVILPEGRVAQVLSIERFASARTIAEAGECVGLTLPEDVPVRRGQVLCDPQDVPRLASELAVRLFWASPGPLRRGERLVGRLATQEAECRVRRIRRRIDSASLDVLEEDAERLEEAEVGDVDLALSPPLVAEAFSAMPPLGRLVLEREGRTAAAGTVQAVSEAKTRGAS